MIRARSPRSYAHSTLPFRLSQELCRRNSLVYGRALGEIQAGRLCTDRGWRLYNPCGYACELIDDPLRVNWAKSLDSEVMAAVQSLIYYHLRQFMIHRPLPHLCWNDTHPNLGMRLSQRAR